jgi:hypothetical protein
MAAAPWSPGFAAPGDGSRGAVPAGDALVIPARRTPRTGARRRTTLNLRSPELLITAKTFRIAKTFRSQRANFLHRAKSLRDHGDAPSCPM